MIYLIPSDYWFTFKIIKYIHNIWIYWAGSCTNFFVPKYVMIIYIPVECKTAFIFWTIFFQSTIHFSYKHIFFVPLCMYYKNVVHIETPRNSGTYSECNVYFSRRWGESYWLEAAMKMNIIQKLLNFSMIQIDGIHCFAGAAEVEMA